jgi:hypothetical protein
MSRWPRVKPMYSHLLNRMMDRDSRSQAGLREINLFSSERIWLMEFGNGSVMVTGAASNMHGG